MANRSLRISLSALLAAFTFTGATIIALIVYVNAQFYLALFLLLLPLAVASFIAGYFVVGVYVKPLETIVAKAKLLERGQRSVVFTDNDTRTAPREISDLAPALDDINSDVRIALAEVAAESKRQSQFISDVAHELRTPLTAIRGAAETLLDDDVPPDDRTRFCSTIIYESDRLTRLANNLMTLQRIEGDGEIVLKRVDLHDILERAAAMLEPLLEDREACLTIGGEAPDVLGDPDRLQQVAQNLIENASRFVGSQGRIHVELSGIREHSVITVSDDGPGFGDIDPARLFDRFYRGDFSRARKTGGIGLGLAIVKAIVTAHDGTVEAVNLPGGGACFIVAIPSLPPAETAGV